MRNFLVKNGLLLLSLGFTLGAEIVRSIQQDVKTDKAVERRLNKIIKDSKKNTNHANDAEKKEAQ